ncbi:MAG TPA: sulfatase-like hydrolase/transferase, partial [Planctomycetota bacterium]|nr:sulfatase-like hydrolase/transferase [Planctomycetota bacterium]
LVVLFATCSLNRGFLAPYGTSTDCTPALAKLAEQSMVFERHMTEAGASGVAYASLFTGLQADRHGVYLHPSQLGEDVLTIFEAFAAAGWETHYFHGHRMAAPELGYAQGVAPEHLVPLTGEKKKRRALSREDASFTRLLERLQADSELRALVVVNFTVTHGAYTAQIEQEELDAFLAAHPEKAQGFTPDDLRRLGKLYEDNRLALQWDFERTAERLALSRDDQELLARVLAAVYAADVGLLDGIVGGALDNLRASRLDQDTLFAFTSDHGEYHFQRERLFQWSHDLQLTPDDLCVPWLLRPARGAFAPGRYPAVTRSIDVFPTLAGLCGVPLPAGAV